ncbi:MAG TPA: radical SAM protein [Vicinamibacteria bacterium]
MSGNGNHKLHLPVLQAGGVLDAPLRLPGAATPEGRELPALERPPEGTGPVRASSYVVYVDLPDDGERMLLTHTYTGAYDRVSRRVATYVRSLEGGPAPRPLYGAWSPEPPVDGEVVTPSEATRERLFRRGYLTRMTREEEEAYFSLIASRIHHLTLQRQPGYVLMPTYQCNLRCAYCFQDHMRTNPAFSHLLRSMSTAMVDRIFRGMDQIDAAHGIDLAHRPPRGITLFGGEPLLAQSRPLIDYIMKKAAESGGATFTAVSNCTELHAYRDVLGPKGIASVQVTLDGPPEEHDQRRIYADGSGSFARIAENVTMALERGTVISARMNIDRGNVGRLPVLAEEFQRRGWDRFPNFSAYVAAVHAANDNVEKRSTLDTWELGQAIADLQERFPAMALINKPDSGLLQRVRGLFEQRADPMPLLKSSFCGAHNTMYVIDAFADIYACWERTGDAKTRIGAIAEDGEVRMNSALFNMWRRRNVTTNPVCRQCRYNTYCGGGCAAYAEQQHGGDMFTNFCDGYGKRFRDAVARAYGDFVAGAPARQAAESVCDM